MENVFVNQAGVVSTAHLKYALITATIAEFAKIGNVIVTLTGKDLIVVSENAIRIVLMEGHVLTELAIAHLGLKENTAKKKLVSMIVQAMEYARTILVSVKKIISESIAQ
jgi:hypothetical protein